jgi:hypothetical protein
MREYLDDNEERDVVTMLLGRSISGGEACGIAMSTGRNVGRGRATRADSVVIHNGIYNFFVANLDHVMELDGAICR